jgi:hypothetical protein
MHGTALLADQDVADGVLLEQGVVDREDRAAGIAEYDVDTLIDQGLEQQLGAGEISGRHRRRHSYPLWFQQLTGAVLAGNPAPPARGRRTLDGPAKAVNAFPNK